jgi:hypothetical protein
LDLYLERLGLRGIWQTTLVVGIRLRSPNWLMRGERIRLPVGLIVAKLYVLIFVQRYTEQGDRLSLNLENSVDRL